MHFLPAILAFLATATATPISTPEWSSNIPNTTTFTLTPLSSRTELFHSDSIMVPFAGGNACSSINATLQSHVPSGVSAFWCFAIDSGASMNLTFVTAATAEATVGVVKGLQEAFSSVPFLKRATCLMEGVEAQEWWSGKLRERSWVSWMLANDAEQTEKTSAGEKRSWVSWVLATDVDGSDPASE